MDADYITDLEDEVRVLRDRVTELEAELVEARENLNIALERKIEEVIIPFIPGFRLLGLHHRFSDTIVISLAGDRRRMRVYRRKRPTFGM